MTARDASEPIRDPSGVNMTYGYDGFLPTSETWSGPITGSVSRTFDNEFLLSGEAVNGQFTVSYNIDPVDLHVYTAGDSFVQQQSQTALNLGAYLQSTYEDLARNGFGEEIRFPSVS